MPQGFVMQKYLLNFKTFIRKSHSDRSQNRSQNSKDTKAVGGVEVGGGLLISHLWSFEVEWRDSKVHLGVKHFLCKLDDREEG